MFTLKNMPLIISIITSIATLITSLATFISARKYHSQAVQQFFTEIGDKDFIKIRKAIYNQNTFKPQDEEASFVINFYNKWGHMTKLRYLPLKIFNSSNGIAVIRFYNRLYPNIIENRQKNKLYAQNFEWLYNKIRKKYKFEDIT